MALAAELMCQAAIANNPGLEFIGYNDMRILKGIVLDSDSLKLNLYAEEAVLNPDGTYSSVAEIKSEGGKLQVSNAKSEIILAYKGFTRKAPDPVKVNIGNKYNYSIKEAYNDYLFHGEFLQALTNINGWSNEGIAAISKTSKPVEDWFANPKFTNWQSDPLMIDAAYQLMILWTTEEMKAPSLPNYAKRYRQFVKSFDGQPLTISAKTAKHGSSTATARIQFVNTDGEVLAEIEGYECTLNSSLSEAFKHRNLGA